MSESQIGPFALCAAQYSTKLLEFCALLRLADAEISAMFRAGFVQNARILQRV